MEEKSSSSSANRFSPSPTYLFVGNIITGTGAVELLCHRQSVPVCVVKEIKLANRCLFCCVFASPPPTPPPLPPCNIQLGNSINVLSASLSARRGRCSHGLLLRTIDRYHPPSILLLLAAPTRCRLESPHIHNRMPPIHPPTHYQFYISFPFTQLSSVAQDPFLVFYSSPPSSSPNRPTVKSQRSM